VQKKEKSKCKKKKRASAKERTYQTPSGQSAGFSRFLFLRGGLTEESISSLGVGWGRFKETVDMIFFCKKKSWRPTKFEKKDG